MWITYAYFPPYRGTFAGWYNLIIERNGPDMGLCSPGCNECCWLVPGTVTEG